MNTVHSYMDNFHRCLLSVTNAFPAEVLDGFLRGLVPEVRHQVLVQRPVDFATAVLVAERLGGAKGEAPRGTAAGHQGPTPMELGQAQGQGHATYTPHGGFAGWNGRRGSAGGGPGSCTCHYCH